MKKEKGFSSFISKVIIVMAIIAALIVAIYIIFPNIKEHLFNHETPALSEKSDPHTETDTTSDENNQSNNSSNDKNDHSNNSDTASSEINLSKLNQSYDPYLLEPSEIAKQIYNDHYDNFSDSSHIQSKRNPSVIEFFAHSLLENPGSYAKDPGYDPFPEYKMSYFSQWDQRWGYTKYAGEEFGISGCGPTVLTMVYNYLTGDTDVTPESMGEFATSNGYALDGNGSSWMLMSEGAEKLGLTVETLILHKPVIDEALLAGKPIILVLGPGHFTSQGHFVAIHDIDENGDYLIFDPFNIHNAFRTFSYAELEDQIRNIWAYSY